MNQFEVIQAKLDDHRQKHPKPRPKFPAPLAWQDPIPKRHYMLGRAYQLGTVQGVIAPGGTGKSALMIAEALAIASAKAWITEQEVDFLGYCADDAFLVWLWNLEEDDDELKRRFYATALRHNLDPEEFKRWPIFVTSGIDHPIRTTSETPQGHKVNEPEFIRIERLMGEAEIDALIIDPFISTHTASENDNGIIDALVKRWARMARKLQVSITLVHHTRKLGGQEADAESARGAKAFIDACRHIRVLNKMSEAEAEKAGLDDHRGYFRVDDAKVNYSRPEKSRWFRIEGVPLGNGDDVGVIVPWSWPDAFDGFNAGDLLRVQRAIDGKGLRYSDQSSDGWVGETVAEVLDLDATTDRRRIKKMIETWLRTGALVKGEKPGPQRKPVVTVEVGEWASE